MNLNKLLKPDLINGDILPSLASFTLPLLVSLVFQQLYNAVDAVIVGHFLKESSLAAVGASAVLFELLVGFGNGFCNGLSIVASRAFGSGDEKKLKKVVATSIVLTLIVTAFVTILSRFCLSSALSWLGTPEEIKDEAFSYINTVTLFVFVLFAFNLFSGLLRAIGNSFMPLVFLIISSVLNIFLDLLFITKLNLGIRGAAIATVIAQGISAVLCLFYIFSKAQILIPSKIHFSFEKKLCKDLFAQGSSMALMGSLVSSGSVILQSAINGFGSFVIAGHLAARKIFSILNIPLLSLGTASSTFVSQNLGAGKIERIKKGVKIAILLTIIWALVSIVLLRFTIRPLLVFISGSSNEILLDYGTRYMNFCIPFFLSLGSLFVLRNALQGLGSKILPLISSIIELIGKIVFTALIVPKIGVMGIIMCEPIIWVIMTVQLMIAFFRHPVFREKRRGER
ncbi:MAG: MATE family efflux transporter [Treponema sp.]|nr:MATE family efflux transporter [Treponema sp.]